MTVTPLLLLLLVALAYGQPSRCHLCIPHSTNIHWIPPSKPPCLHPGQPIFEWPGGSGCSRDLAIHSEQISVDETGLVFAKQRLCFYFTIELIEYSYGCMGAIFTRRFKIGHPTFSKQRRFKRWLRRRNPDPSAIHFQQESYVKELLESATPGTLVVTVKATHATEQPLYYSLAAPQDSRSQNIFTLDTISGEIRLAKSLDREILDKHVLKVTAYERLDPTVSSSVTVTVDVLDVQDNSPIFERDSYFADIREDAPIGTTVLSVFARDLDSGENGEIIYSLGEGDGHDYLSINSRSGVIQTAAPLDRETLPLIRLDVIATDKGEPPRQSSALVEIGITDVNDNAPIFEKEIYNISVMENATLPAVIAQIKATDKDSGVNGKVHYSIAATSSVPLTIDYTTGEVVLRERVDAKSSPIAVLARAKDGAQPALSSTVTLMLYVIDINDHAPTFIASQKKIFLDENVAVGDEVGRVYAIDDDSGENGVVRYALNGSLDFFIDAESGIIRTASSLDRERAAQYELQDAEQKIVYRIEHMDRDVVALIDLGEQGALLTLSGQLHSSDHLIKLQISATDQGGLQGRCQVNLIVEDVNSAPYFKDQPFTVRVPEDSPIGFHVVTLKAEDTDQGNNAHLTFLIDSREFTIDNVTGLIVLKKLLDREEQSSYLITVTVSDGAVPPLNTTTQLEIIVDDVNDNAPKFSTQNYSASIPEDIPVGTSFMQVSAIDLDIGNNGIVDYFLNDSNASAVYDLFRLDRTSGTLRVNSKLDREQYPVIELRIFARDRGKPPLTSSSLITVTLTDVNDNAPKFDQAFYDLYIAENSPVGSTVGTIMATDPDEGDNAKIQFRIFGGPDAKLFDLEVDENQPGVVRILTRAEFDYEAKNNKFYLEVQATSGQLSSTVVLRVHVSDVNDNRPILADFIVLINRFESESTITQIGMVPAFDPDQNATLEYYMEENQLLTVEKFTGKLTLKSQWKRNIDAQFKTCVSDGPNRVCAICRFIHVYVNQDSLREAATLFLPKMSLDDFWDPPVFNRFRQSLATLDTWEERNVFVVGAQHVAEGVEVNLVVIDRGRVIKSWKVEDLLRSEVKKLERLSLMKVDIVRDESCAKEPCPYYQKCRQTLKHVDAVDVYQTDSFIARTMKTLKTFVCECPSGFTSSIDLPGQCDLRMDQCYSNPCRNNATCHPLENGYRCDCEQCEIAFNSLTCIPGYCKGGSVCELFGAEMMCKHCGFAPTDADERCRLRSLGFEGRGLVNINKALTRLEWELSFRLATISRDAVLLFSGDRSSDFVEISINDRVLQAEFSLGGKPKILRMENERRNRVNDGEWHTVRVMYYDRHLTILLDECDVFVALHAHGSAPCAAQARIDLPAKCVDLSVPCYRFLDVYNGIFLGGRPTQSGKIDQGYSGCIANFTLNEELIDFSSLKDMDVRGTVHEGCKHRKDFCEGGSCAANAKCANRWDDLTSPHSRPLTLTDDESFVIYRPEEVSVPFTLSFEFRTSRTDTQIIVVEFEQRNIFYRVEIDDGLLRVWLAQSSVLADAPELHPGHWTKIDVEFREEEVETTIDGIYKTTSKHSMFDMVLDQIYSGLAPSTGHPSRFEGCFRDLTLNGEPQAVSEKGKVRHGCIVANRCNLDGVCPKESSCQREWNRHSCKCHRGFAGDTCLPVCSLPGICASNGFCLSTNSTRGYDCQCQTGFVGVNCERAAAVQACPQGYWGKFPHCKKCICPEGFEVQCDKDNGNCHCPKFQFPLRGRCVNCECGYGATSLQCSVDGQCRCSGQASGRRCDRCKRDHHVLDPKSLKCHPIRDHCPSQIEYGIQWPTTAKGMIARQSCPTTQSGLATRDCDANGRWEEVNSFNCTRPEYGIMVSKYDVLNSVELLTMLRNATHGTDTIAGRNLDIARTALDRIFDTELRLDQLEQNHLKDTWFTESLVLTAGRIAAYESSPGYLDLVKKLAEYSKAVFNAHEQMPFLEAFQFASEHIVFSMDALDFSNTLPKYNNFIDHRPKNFPKVRIHIENATRAFYSIFAHPRCTHCETPIVTVFARTFLPIRVEFELNETTGWRYPECVLLPSSHSSWSTRHAHLVALNLTHAMCEFEIGGVYTVFAREDSENYLRLSHSTTLVSPVLAGMALLFCLLSTILTLARRAAGARFIRLGFIVCFILNATNLYFLNKISVNQTFCPMRNAILSFTSLGPFAWLFLYSLHLYRMLAEARARSSAMLCLLLGVVIPALVGCVSFLLAAECSVAPQEWLFWVLTVPIAFMLLLSFYASATSFLVSSNKQFDVIVVKFQLRRALCQHFILCSLVLLHTGVTLFSSFINVSGPLKELMNNITLVGTALYILIWSVCPAGKDSPNTTATMWLDGPQKSGVAESTALRCESPVIEEEPKHENWAPEAIPCDPFLTSTPIRDQRVESRERDRENPIANAILSPADKILSDGLGHVYGNMGTLTRFRTEEDDADDAYYTYTASRRYKQSTFSKP
ncbi:cadherin domain protein [Necator americanus]|uniref:Cadherin domain protein n=1 Tax=Necator americanus TaxID=51031 RepID=W2T4I0_NECAM|nr:cadherin domain protein [Necator americanus]ETN76935.1 cadherin domain protein [Necator americanus]